ncbi:MAG: NAD(P)/FAD-dependent oxidoreductase [Rhizobiaceae bacterium]|nr:NAD(P)/FAD-dependent oxidoreductase [Rhizobiaceae bacterium]MCZ8352888.1 NAD(P)/FAD-dependent oxidoreductase [Rhizobium sp.]
MSSNAPIVVSGAGPVGLSLALALARSGIRSVVLEKKPKIDAHSRATLIVPRSLEFFYRLGVLAPFLDQGQRNDAIRILRASDRKPMLTFDFSELADRTPTPYALALSQDRTERILLDAVLATGLVDIAFDTALERFDASEDGVHIIASGGRELEAKVLVGADGAHSAVRKQLGWELEGKTYPTRAVLADVSVSPEADTTAGWLADPNAGSFTIAIRFADGVWRIIEAAVDDTLAEEDLPGHAKLLTERMFGPGSWRQTLWTAAYKKHERRTSRLVAGRVVLAGDAAHLNSPAGGQGMNAGLADAELLARQLQQGLAQPHLLQTNLHHYEQERIRAFDRDIRSLTDKLEAMETLPAWARSLMFSALGLARAAGLERIAARRLSMLPQLH